MLRVKGLAASEPVRVAALVLATLLVLFAPYVFGGASLLSASHDASSIFVGGADPMAAFPGNWKVQDPNGSNSLSEPDAMIEHRQLFTEHELPLWDPGSGMGTPELAAMQPESFSPFNALMVLAPGRIAMNITVIARLFVAGFFAYTFFRLFVPAAGAIAGGIAFMLNGYFLLFSTQPYLSVDVLLPAYLFALERLLRRANWSAAGWPALVATFTFFGGMPEATLLLQSYAALWVIFRIASDPELRARWAFHAVQGASAAALGVAGALILLVPFAAYLRVSFDDHQAANVGGQTVGAISTIPPDIHTLALALMPLLFGTPHPNLMLGSVVAHPGAFNFASVTATFCALLALIALRGTGRAERTAVLFFLALFLGSELKIMGFPIVNWIGNLPLFSVVTIDKYVNPEVSFSLAGLVAFGIATLARGTTRSWELALAGGTTAMLLAVAIGATSEDPTVLAMPRDWYFFSAVGAIVALSVVLLFALNASRSRAIAGVLAILVFESLLNYAVPLYWFVDRGPSPAPDPYAGSPFIDFMRNNTIDDERIFGAPGVLNPHWSGSFGLQDIRDVDALTDKRLYPFLTAFVPAQHQADTRLEFVGNIGNDGLSTPLIQRLLTLSSVGLIAGKDLWPDWSAAPFDPSVYRLLYGREASVYRYLRPLPRASMYQNAVLAPDGAAALHALVAPGFDPFRDLMITQPTSRDSLSPKLTSRAAPRVSVIAAHITHYSSNHVTIESDAGTNERFLMLNDVNFPGWNARIDGSPVPVYEADDIFRAVVVPPGQHRIEFAFEPAGFQLATLVSVFALLAAVTLIVIDTRRGYTTMSLTTE